jgi:hypothetical protein
MAAIELPNLYFRWTRTAGDWLKADILIPGVFIAYSPGESIVKAAVGSVSNVVELDPDTARMIGVRLIEAASRAEANSKTRG